MSRKSKSTGEPIPAAAKSGGVWCSKEEADYAFTLYRSPLWREKRSKLVAEGDFPWRIVRYQRIIDPEVASYPIANTAFVTPATFAKHLRYFLEECSVVRLTQLLQDIDDGKPIPEGTVAITLDGGWIDTFAYAFPILSKMGVPATVFVPTGYIGTDDYLWPDKVMLALLALKQAGQPFVPFSFFDEDAVSTLRGISPSLEITLPLIMAVNVFLYAASPEDRWVATRTLGEIVTARGIEPPIEPAFGSWEELAVMEKAGIDIGTMGHRHLFYTALSPEAAITDLRESLAALGNYLSRPLGIFAPPEGEIGSLGYATAQELGLPCVLRLDDRGSDRPPKGLHVLPRMPLFEGATYTTSLLACRVWGIR